jgi:hypothetical protein
MSEVCNCAETGSFMGCAGCDVVEDYFPTAEEQEAEEREFHQQGRDEYYAAMFQPAEFDG